MATIAPLPPPPPPAQPPGKNLDAVVCLTANGASERARDKLGKTALELARYIFKSSNAGAASPIAEILQHLSLAPGDRPEFSD